MNESKDCIEVMDDVLLAEKNAVNEQREKELSELKADWEDMDKQAKKYFPSDVEGELNFKIGWLKRSLRDAPCLMECNRGGVNMDTKKK